MTESDRNLIQELASVKERLESEQRLHQTAALRAHRLQTINDFNLSLSEVNSLDEVLAIANRTLRALLPRVNRTSVALIDPGGGSATLFSVTGVDMVLTGGKSMPLPGSMIAAVAEKKAPIQYTVPEAGEPAYTEVRKLAGAGLRAFLAAPMIAKSQVIGTVNTASAEVDCYEEHDAELLQLIAATLALSVEQWQLVHRLDASLLELQKSNTELQRELGERAKAEASARRDQQTIAEQHRRMLEMSTPVIPISDRVVVMPLVGSLSSLRMQQITEVALHRIAAVGADTVILDHTGIESADTVVVDALMRTAAALRLLGCRTILTGIRADLAQVLIHNSLRLDSFEICSTLKEAVRRTLRSENASATR